MRIGRIFAWSGVVVLLVVLIAAGVLYFLSIRQPGSYQPANLDDQQQERVAKEFLATRIIGEFGNAAEFGEPFEWSISQKELNDVLASMDEIAYQLEPRNGREKPVEQALSRMSISSPAVDFQPGKITLMVYSQKYSRVLSADIGMHMTDDGKLKVSLESSRVGLMPLPDSVVNEQLDRLRQALPQKAKQHEHAAAKVVSPEDFGKVIHQVLQAIDGQGIDPVLTWPGNKRKVRIDSIEITDDLLKLHLTPQMK